MTPTSSESTQVLMLMPSDPWSEWTMSGISRQLCLELRRRGALLGAADPTDVRRWSLDGPSFLDGPHRLIRELSRRLARRPTRRWLTERDGTIGRVLAQLPARSNVIYAFHSPEVDQSLDLRRFRLMDLSLKDACRTGSYGFTDIDDAKYRVLYDNQFRTIHASEGILTLSSYAAESISRDFGYDRARIHPIGCGPAVVFHEPVDTSPDRYGRGEILFVGRNWIRKGGPLLLEAFDIVKQAIPHAKLVVVGPDANPAPDRRDVDFLGFLAKDKPEGAMKLQGCFQSASVFCMPSICETWGLVYSEAAMAGVPIAGFHEWALPDIVVDGQTGVLARERTPQALAQAIVSVLEDPARAASLGRNAIKYVNEFLSWSAVVDRMLYAVSTERGGVLPPKWLAGDSLRQFNPGQLTAAE